MLSYSEGPSPFNKCPTERALSPFSQKETGFTQEAGKKILQYHTVIHKKWLSIISIIGLHMETFGKMIQRALDVDIGKPGVHGTQV